MNLKQQLQQVVARLKTEKVRYALAGGLAISAYRIEERATKDIDFLLLAENDTNSLASEIISSFGLTPSIARKADLEGGPLFARKRQKTLPYIVVGRDPNNPNAIGLDFILPAMPWFDTALNRAQFNLIDFGFAKIPCLTVEDAIITKIYSLGNNASRYKDLDDLQAIFLADHPLDIAYLSGQMHQLELSLPLSFEPEAPEVLRLVSKAVRKEIRDKLAKK